MSNEPHGTLGEGMTLTPMRSSSSFSWRNQMATATKKYRCYVTTKDSGNNTKQTNDYCEATSTSEAQRTFDARYPHARITGVQEVR